MNFNLRKPCGNCPFRTDRPHQKGWLGKDRARGIAEQQGTFPCHKTTSATLGDRHNPSKEQQCAGMLIMLEHMGRPNQIMRIAERLGRYDRSQLDMAAPVFTDTASFVNWHGDN